MGIQLAHTIKIFYCYAHRDDALRKQLASHLSPLRRLRYVTGWFDHDIQAGTDWKQEIETQLGTASIILLLISADFIASDYCCTLMQRALEKHKDGTARVIPIILRPVAWEETPIGKLEALPSGKKPVTQWTDRDKAWLDVEQKIREVVRDLLPKPILSPQEIEVLYPELRERCVPSQGTLPISTTLPTHEHADSPVGSTTQDKADRSCPRDVVENTFRSPSQTSSFLRLRRLDAMDLPPLFETHERLITIGRAPKNMIVIPDQDVSWEHGQIIFKQGEYVYCHMSKNSQTILRRKREERLFRPRERVEFPLRNQDRLTIGKTTFVIEFDLMNEDTGYTTTERTPEGQDET